MNEHIIIDVVDKDGNPIPGTLITGYDSEFLGKTFMTHLDATNADGRVLWPRDWESLRIQLYRNGYSSKPLNHTEFEHLNHNDVKRTFVITKPGYAHFHLDPDCPLQANHRIEFEKIPDPNEPALEFTLSVDNPEFVAMMHDTNHFNQYYYDLFEGDLFIQKTELYLITPDDDTAHIWIKPNL